MSRDEWVELVRGWFPELIDAKARSLTYPEINGHREVIAELLDEVTVTTAWQRLRDEHGLRAGISSFRRYVWLEFPDHSAEEKVTVLARDQARLLRRGQIAPDRPPVHPQAGRHLRLRTARMPVLQDLHHVDHVECSPRHQPLARQQPNESSYVDKEPTRWIPTATTAEVVDYVNDHLVDYVNVTPSNLVDSVNADKRVSGPERERLEGKISALEEGRYELHRQVEDRDDWLAAHPEAQRRLDHLDREIHRATPRPDRGLDQDVLPELQQVAQVRQPESGAGLDLGP